MAQDVWIWGTNAGLNQRGHALLCAEGQILEAENLSWLGEGALQMRLGSEAESLSNAGLTGEIQWVFSYLPPDDGPEELWAGANNSGTVAVARRVGGVWNSVTFADTPAAASLRYWQAAVLNGKLFIAYDSNVNRLHVWDGTSVRRVGQLTPSAPSVADTGGGAYANTARRYRVSTRILDGTTVVCESELSSATSFTPSGAALAARVSRPATYESSATHWVVWGLISSAGDTYDLYEELSEVAIATTFYDDSTAPASYDGDFPPELGINVPPPSAKYILSDGERLYLANSWETSADADQTTPQVNRVWYTRALGASDRGDDESIPNTETLGLYAIDAGDASPVTGLGQLFDSVFVFKPRAIQELRSTGDSVSPFSQQVLSDVVGSVDQRVICGGMAPDNSPAIYFADEHQIYMISAGGLTPMGTPVVRDLRAQSIDPADALMIFDPFSLQVFFQMSNSPTGRLGSYSAFVCDIVKQRWTGFSLGGASGGWTLGTDDLGTGAILGGGGATVRTATIGTITSTGTRRLIIGGQDSSAAASLTNFGGQCGLDGSTAYTTRARIRKVLKAGYKFSAGNPTIFYRNPQGSTSGTLTCTLTYLRPAGPDGESVTVSQSTTLTATTDDSGIELQQHTFEGLTWTDASVLDLKMSLVYSGTAFQTVVPPSIDAIMVPVKVQEPESR